MFVDDDEEEHVCLENQAKIIIQNKTEEKRKRYDHKKYNEEEVKDLFINVCSNKFRTDPKKIKKKK